MDKNTINELATKIYNYLPPWEKQDATREDIKRDIEQHPIDVLMWLFDYVTN